MKTTDKNIGPHVRNSHEGNLVSAIRITIQSPLTPKLDFREFNLKLEYLQNSTYLNRFIAVLLRIMGDRKDSSAFDWGLANYIMSHT